MNNIIYKLAKPIIIEEVIKEVVRVLETGNYVQGKKVLEFENIIADYIGTKHAICVSSCTAALHLALIANEIGYNDEVIVPAFTFPATANVVEIIGAKTVLVDITLNDYCIDTRKIEEKISKKTKAIIPVHEFGQAAQIDEIMKIASKYNLKVIEDAACAIGTKYKEQKIGTFGDAACFSFHPRKAITTGEGGVVVTNNDAIAQRIRALRNHGIVYENEKIDFSYAGFNYRMTEIQAAMGIIQMEYLEKQIQHRIEIANVYDYELNNYHSKIRTPSVVANTRNVYQTYHILLMDDNVDRNYIIQKLKENGVETNYGAQALNCLSYFQRKYKYQPNDFPNATKSYNYGLALPMGMHISKNDAKEICKIIKRFI